LKGIVPDERPNHRDTVNSIGLLALLSPLFLVFEIWQLVMSERYVGIKQIARGANPREMGPSELISAIWSLNIIIYGLWMVSLLLSPYVRVYGIILLAVTATGYSFRRNCGLKWILVILTFEGAVRVAVLAPLAVASWMRI
jgi:hypothetical protein